VGGAAAAGHTAIVQRLRRFLKQEEDSAEVPAAVVRVPGAAAPAAA
jgi:hypothetical protein